MFSDLATRRLALFLLLLGAAALVVWLDSARRRMGVTRAQFPIYLFSLVMTRVRWRARVEGKIALPRGQGAIIVCNHICPVDPAFIALACDRQVHWMVAREYCRLPLLGWALKTLQVVPTGRSGVDTAATKLAMRYARQGELVGMFPEGRLNDRRRFMLPGRAGAAMVALRARVPVVPCYIEGSPWDGTDFGFFLMTAKTRLKVGRPIDISEYYGREGDREVHRALTLRFLREIAALAGLPDYEPELAGKGWKSTNGPLSEVPHGDGGSQRPPSDVAARA
ncbi:MAG TPA: lysophospholipid acyltransferase family protein [Pirellulales bacterium]|nr:lysophospholipid acyltransferase family protein [Pirellulales bacterium]